MKSLLLTLIILLILTSNWSYAAVQPMIKDKYFQNGIGVINIPDQQSIDDVLELPNDSVAKYNWKLAQWNSQSSLAGSTRTVDANGFYAWEDQFKSLKISPWGTLELTVNGFNEYDGILKTVADPWPHMLIKQRIHDPNTSLSIAEANKIKLSFSSKLISRDLNGPNLNTSTSQYTMYLTIQNLNLNSAGYGDYLWFGIPIYDRRYEFIAHAVAGDPGTSKMIYGNATEDFTNISMHSQTWVDYDADILPLIQSALIEAWKRGYLPDSKCFTDYYIGGFNVGYEVSNLDIHTIRLKNLSMEFHH